MASAKERVFVHKFAVIHIEEFRSEAKISFAIRLDQMRDRETGTFLIRCPAFPAQVGAGDSLESAEKSLRQVFQAYIESFLQLNGIEGFREKLLKNGFRLAEGPDPYGDLPDWEPWMVSDFIPSVEVPTKGNDQQSVH